MNLTTWLDVAIGLGVIYLGASLFVTILSEYVSQVLNLRGRALFGSLERLIADPDVREKLAAHPVLQPFFGSAPKASGKSAPSYVDPNVLARALIAAGTAPGAQDAALPPSIQALFGPIGKQAAPLVTSLSQWLDASLTILGERYKRWIRWVTFGLAALVAIGLNLDTTAITLRLYQDKEARDSVAAVAIDLTGKLDARTFETCARSPASKDPVCAPVLVALNGVQRRSESLGKLPIGYPLPDPADGESVLWTWVVRVVGWLLTACALSLGAPFWFDLLGRLVNIRHGIGRPEVAVPAAGGEAAPPSPVVPAPAAPAGAGAGPLRLAAGKDAGVAG